LAATTEPAREVGVQARHVGEHADLDHAVGNLRLGRTAARAGTATSEAISLRFIIMSP
jgi:hypothetical protein